MRCQAVSPDPSRPRVHRRLGSHCVGHGRLVDYGLAGAIPDGGRPRLPNAGCVMLPAMAKGLPKPEDDLPARVDTFIARWQGREGGQERANYALFLTELCSTLELTPPDPADAKHEANDYVFERVVKEAARDGAVATRRIDLYKRNSFVLEAKQSRQKGGEKEIPGQTDLFVTEVASRGRRGAERAWDVLMMNARRQAEDYVRLLPAGHEPPPFVIVCDVGHCLELYANFRRDGKAYDQFPDRQSFRVFLEDLRQPEVLKRLVSTGGIGRQTSSCGEGLCCAGLVL
jgi:hypothetical protein